MNLDRIKTPEDIYEWIDTNIQYGWLDTEGNKHIDEMKNFRKLYRTMSMELRGGKESPTTQFFEVPGGLSFQSFNAFINNQ